MEITLNGTYSGPYATSTQGQTVLRIPLPKDSTAGSTVTFTLQ